MKSENKAWLLLAYGEEQSYGGHSGYNDIIHEVYRYDNFVPNHKRISEGDLVVIRNQEVLLGVARIILIESQEGVKERKRCPECNTTNFDQRTTKIPVFRCADGHEFDNPIHQNEVCTNYSAYFGNTFIHANGVLDRHQLTRACPKYNQQLAMQLIEFDQIKSAIVNKVPGIESFFDDLEDQSYLYPLEAYEVETKQQDIAKSVIRQIKERRGQKKIRQALIEFYGSKCVITGCDIVDILEAAHISPYSFDYNNAISNGLLLRSDIHTLFDLDLLGIDPQSLTIHLHQEVKKGDYKKYENMELPSIAKRINQRALKIRWKNFQSRLLQ